MPAEASTALATSIRISRRPGSAGSTRGAPRMTTNDSGMFTYRHHRQFSALVSTPPSTRPTASPAVSVAVKIPIARARSCPSVYTLTSSDLVEETSTAPNAPCTARAVMSIAPSTAAPPTADAAANPTTPISSVFRAPNRSARRPPSRSSPASASVYEVTTHCRPATVSPSPRCTDGSATNITVVSSTAIRCAAAITASGHHPRRVPRSPSRSIPDSS